MKKMRALIERYEKWLMIGLVVFLCVIFTVTADIEAFFAGEGREVAGANDVIGSFYVVPDQEVEVTNARYARARLALRVLQDVTRGMGSDDVGVLEVWSHLILAEAAAHEGVYVSDEELVTTMRTINPSLGAIMQDPERYKEFVQNRYGINRLQFEEAFREVLTSLRMRELHVDTFSVSPPATRKELVERYAPRKFEYVDVSWAALDAARFLDGAEKALDAAAAKEEGAKEKLLEEFFKTDPSVKTDTTSFRFERRYDFEMLYAIHDRLTEENQQRLEEMFFKAWPQYSKEKNEGKDPLANWPKDDDKKQWNWFKDRLLKLENQTETGLREKATAQVDKEDAGADDGEEKNGEPNGDPEKDDPEKDEGEEKSDEEEAALKAAREARIQKALDEMGFDIVRDRIHRELRLRRMFRLMHNDAFDKPEVSLEKLWERLKEFDDKDDPLLSKTPGEGVIVFRKFDAPLSREEIESLTDGTATFGPNVSLRVSQAAREKLPFVRKSAEPLGDLGDGRMLIRVMGFEQERRKTYAELSDGEKQILVDDYYIPHHARERAKEALEALRTSLEEGKVKPDGFREAAVAVGARVYENEGVTASTQFMTEPDRKLLFPSEYARMRDRHFLRTHLAGLLAADRIKKEDERIKPGSWLDVELRSNVDDEDDDDLGSAYLILLLDREKPTAATMPEENLVRARLSAQRQGTGRDRERWNGQYRQLFSDFNVKFDGTMKTQIDAAFERIEQAERDRANAAVRGP